MNLKKFLDSKPLYYDSIDYEFFPKIWTKYKHKLKTKAKVVHIVGTNGKGTTGKTISTYLSRTNYKVGHFSSPFLYKWCDIWTINNQLIDDDVLKKAHKFLQGLLNRDEIKHISRFEYSTLMCFKLFEFMDFVVLEAGLGGEKDATNVHKKYLSVFVCIGFDHTEFLGKTVNKIATTKLNSMDKNMIIGCQKYDEVIKIATNIAKQKNTKYHNLSILTNKEKQKIQKYFSVLPKFLIQNISLAVAATKLLGMDIKISNLKNLKFEARFEQINDNIIIDVGHNSLSAMAIKDFIKQGTILIYNCLYDKNFKVILDILKPKIKMVYILNIKDKRVVNINTLKKEITSLGMGVDLFENNTLKKENNYLVYGSFVVVRTFMKGKYWKKMI